MDKILKVLWLVNGVLLLVMLSFLGYKLILEEFFKNRQGIEYDPSLVIGGEQAEALKKGKELQGVVYSEIEPVPGTSFHVLPLSARRFNSEKKTGSSYLLPIMEGPGQINLYSSEGNINLIFLDIDYKVINTLLDRKAFIHSYYSPAIDYQAQNILDPTVKNIVYLISFEDSNQDGLLNESDSADLYISDVDGANLVQVTKNLHILDYKFINNNSEVLIAYRPVGESSEYERRRFAKYRVANETLLELSDLHESILEVEKQLMVDTTRRMP